MFNRRNKYDVPAKRIQAATTTSTERRADFGCWFADDFIVDAADEST